MVNQHFSRRAVEFVTEQHHVAFIDAAHYPNRGVCIVRSVIFVARLVYPHAFSVYAQAVAHGLEIRVKVLHASDEIHFDVG